MFKGRSARAGRAGRALSLVSAEDVAHLLDLHLFLGAQLINPSEVRIIKFTLLYYNAN